MNKISGPAPSLSKIYFVAIQGSADDNWQYINGAASAQLPCTGQSIYLCLDFIGYPNLYTVRFYSNGTVIDVNQVISYINLQQPLTKLFYYRFCCFLYWHLPSYVFRQ